MGKEPDGVLAVIAGDGDELIEDDRLLRRRRAPIPGRDTRE